MSSWALSRFFLFFLKTQTKMTMNRMTNSPDMMAMMMGPAADILSLFHLCSSWWRHNFFTLFSSWTSPEVRAFLRLFPVFVKTCLGVALSGNTEWNLLCLFSSVVLLWVVLVVAFVVYGYMNISQFHTWQIVADWMPKAGFLNNFLVSLICDSLRH